MGRWLIPVYVAACAAGLGAFRSAAQPDSLLHNPGFEADANGDGLPDEWTFAWQSTHSGDAQRGIEKQEPDWARDTQVKHSGDASVRCGVSRAVDDGVWNQEAIALPEGAKYLRVRAWCCAENVKGGAGTVGVVFLGEGGRWLGAAYQAITVDRDTDWTQYTGYAAVPKGTQTLRVRVWTNFAYRGTGTFWFDDLELTPVAEMVTPKTVYLNADEPLPAPTTEEWDSSIILLTRSYLRLVFPNSDWAEAERVSRLKLAACPGEYKPVPLVVRALRDLVNLTVVVSDLAGAAGTIPASAIDVRSVRYQPKEGQARWGPFNETLMDVPLFLEKRNSIDLPPGTNQPFWLTVRVPEDTTTGQYAGTVTISASHEHERREIPLEVSVRPFRLAEPKGITFGLYAKMRTDPAWLQETFADMRAHGMTSIGLCGNSGLAMSVQDGKVGIDWNGQSTLERNMDEYVRTGFPEPLVWLMGGDIPKVCEGIAAIDTEEFTEAYRQVITAINEHGKQAGWPEIIYQPIDEPFEHEKLLDRAMRLLQILKTVPGVRTEEDGMNGAWHNFSDECYRLTDVLCLHDGPVLQRGTLDLDQWWDFHAKCQRDGKLLWFYNIDLTGWHPEPMRFMTGFGLWKSRAQGVIEWAYMFPVNEDDPGAVYSQPKALLYRFPVAPGESGGPCVAYEAMREGIDDYRYLLTLAQLVEQAKASGNPEVAKLAEDAWRPVQSRLDAASLEGCRGSAAQGDWTGACEILPDGNRAVRGDHKIANNWDFADYDALRKQIADGIIRLTQALQG
jgi:hypothetical protein